MNNSRLYCARRTRPPADIMSCGYTDVKSTSPLNILLTLINCLWTMNCCLINSHVDRSTVVSQRATYSIHVEMQLFAYVHWSLRLASPQGGPKKLAHFLYALTLLNIYRLSKLFHCQNPEKIGSNAVTDDATTRQLCRYTTLWNVSVLKATIIENKTTSACNNTFKKGNNVFIVSAIV